VARMALTASSLIRPRIVVNADDYGRSESVTTAIEASCTAGCVSSTTVMANMPGAAALFGFHGRHPSVSVGLHVNLTEGRPVLAADAVPSLVDSSGAFWGRRRFFARLCYGQIRTSEMRLEIGAQLARLETLTPVVTHFDSHQHIHVFPPVLHAMIAVARGTNAARRARTNRRLFISPHRTVSHSWLQLRHCARHPAAAGGIFLKVLQERYFAAAGVDTPDYLVTSIPIINSRSRTAVDLWVRLLLQLPPATLEINCHPGSAAGDEEIFCNAKFQRMLHECAQVIAYDEITANPSGNPFERHGQPL
jgi:predicted glycoside hydrolase/deacetylase ChbG (UPF0249 family)